jgi:hypothetical protein
MNDSARRLLIAVSLLGQLALFQPLSTIASQKPQAPTERRVEVQTTRKTPLSISEVRVRKGVIDPAKPFKDEDEDWFRGFSATFKNNAPKEVLYVEASVTFHFGGDSVPIKTVVTWGAPDGNTLLKPGASATMSMTDETYGQEQMLMIRHKYPSSFNHVNVFIQGVMYADGVFWRNGRDYRRDPMNPENWIRIEP